MEHTMKLPVYVSQTEVAAILGWSRQKTKRWLANAKALVKRGDKWVTTPDKLREAFPEVWDEILNSVEEES